MILIPVKHLAHAKQRLASWFDQTARTQLAQTMLTDICEVIAAWPDRPEAGIVTSDPLALHLARQFGFAVIPDPAQRGETEAIVAATNFCVMRGVASTLVIPADIPLLTVAELRRIFDAAPAEGTVLVSAADGRGTNAAFRRPPSLIELHFGNDSFRPHVEAAHATGKPCVTLSLPGIALDVDNPSDLRQLAISPGNTRSQRLVRQWNLADLPSAANE